MSKTAASLKPRKTPIQARSLATVNALHTATIQVLVREGLSGCTTTRVAERAGMSVGSLYQYYPNRDSLLADILEKHLDHVAEAVEQVCHAHRHMRVSRMAAALVSTFLAVKLRDPQESKALYAVAGERGGVELAARVHARLVTAIADMLTSASDAAFDDPPMIAAISLSSLMGPVRACLEGQARDGFEARLEEHLVRLLTAYLETYRR